MSTFQPVRGMRDLIAEDAETLSYVIGKARETAQLFGFKEVITPVVEPFELLSAKSGEEIRQRMFIFDDLGGRKVSLRPEFTASIARLTTTTLKNEPKPLRLFSAGSVYRYDEPQKGRYREFWQANFELMGSGRPEADAEVILLANNLLKNTGLKNFALKLGHVGVLKGIMTQEGIDDKAQNAILQKMDKKEYETALALVDSENCRKILRGLIELKGANVFDTVDKMKTQVQGYEKAVAAVENLEAILRLVTESGCEIEVVDPAFARGLEYYTGVIFELYVPQLEIALGGGGRYDKLIEVFGGESTPAVGMATGIDRIALAMQAQKTRLQKPTQKRVTVIPIKEEQKAEALKIAQMLREAGLPAEFEVMGRKMGKALEDADKRKVDYAVIVGERELKEGKVVLKDLVGRTQAEVNIETLPSKIRENGC
ncbi:MAG: histidine--tRNA ligase [Candidatus Bathyarchaeota archaeon]|nr:histidine--tRNA ligase [Candidatus Bathyarchaeota archaeon]